MNRNLFAAFTAFATVLLALGIGVMLRPISVSANPIYPPRNGDPCALNVRQTLAISQTANAKLISGTSAKYTYICHLGIISATAQNVALVEGTGSTCGTSTAGMAGGATAATGWNFAANGGLMEGTGQAWVLGTATAADDVCLLQSGSGQVSGVIDYVQQ